MSLLDKYRIQTLRDIATPEQLEIWKTISSCPIDHIEIQARAGCGKSSTILEGMKECKGTVAFLAYGTDIAADLRKKAPPHLAPHIRTYHSFGLRAINTHNESVLQDGKRRAQVDKSKTYRILDTLSAEQNIRWRKGQRQTVKRLVSLAKERYYLPRQFPTTDTLIELASDNDIEYPFGNSLTLATYALHVLEESLQDTLTVDFDDMLWLPMMLNLPLEQYDHLMVDEAQDLNSIQHSLSLRVGHRFIVVGDTEQAIYAFRGADTNSIPNFFNLIRANQDNPDSRTIQCTLTTSFRCAKKITALARHLVPDIHSLPDAPEGTVSILPEDDLTNTISPGDMIVCRVNADLLTLLFRLWKEGHSAYILGRDFGEEIITLADNLNASSPLDLLTKLREYQTRRISELERRPNTESQIQHLHDKCDCLRLLVQSTNTLSELREHMERIFVRSTPATSIRLSTIHKSKGLESDRVFILRPDLLPHPRSTDTELEQERHLCYVAITRARHTLYFLNTLPGFYRDFNDPSIFTS
jgi:DNA helicase-2/ATP-dependent DNA helicase PcrA